MPTARLQKYCPPGLRCESDNNTRYGTDADCQSGIGRPQEDTMPIAG